MGWFTKEKHESCKDKIIRAHRKALMEETLKALKQLKEELKNEILKDKQVA